MKLFEIGEIQTVGLTAENDFVRKSVKTSNPVKVISELIWNALDADAEKVIVKLIKNELGGLKEISVIDDGHGINPDRLEADFKQLGGSWKQDLRKTPKGRVIHGKEGKGRLHFHSVCEIAEWETTFLSPDGQKNSFHLKIETKNIRDTKIKRIVADEKPVGTIVTLGNLGIECESLDSKTVLNELSQVFAHYLSIYSSVKIIYNGFPLDPAIDIDFSQKLPGFHVEASGGRVEVKSLDIIVWKNSSDQRKIYFGSEPGAILDSQPAGVRAPDISFSAYAYSDYFEEAQAAGLLGLDNLNEPRLIDTFNAIRDKVSDVILEYSAEKASGIIEEYKEKGIYPYKQDPVTQADKVEQEMFAVAARAATSYSRTFRNTKDDEKKMMLSLLKEAFVSNPDSLKTILSAVFGLPKTRQNQFADILNQTTLSNVVETTGMIGERLTALDVLGRIVFDKDLRKNIKERGQLDTYIQKNTWIFGEKFHLTMHEAGLTKILRELTKNKKAKPVKRANGKTGRVDTLLGRSLPHADGEVKEYLILELKRPKLTIKSSHAEQILSYAMSLAKREEFKNTDTRWNYFLIGRNYDEVVSDRIGQDNREYGIYYQKDNVTVWVKSWAEIIRSCEGRLSFINSRLNYEISDQEVNSKIAEITSAFA